MVYAAQGDPRRTLSLLWRGDDPPESRPGPRPTLTVDEIIATAVSVADAAGTAGMSMRTVGKRLGRTAMALYTYVADKHELLDLMYDHVHAELTADADPADWRGALTAWAEELWEFYLRHPWVLSISPARPILGPHETAMTERLLRVLQPLDLPSPTLRGVTSAVIFFVQGNARAMADARAAAQDTGQSDDEWWAARAPHLMELAGDFGTRFPLLTRLEADHTPSEGEPYLERDARAAFTVGLGVLIDGIAAAR
nr:TetR/AcrR family transcriptional regulator C-terminal domain-containing protein [Actinokineospora enzanensis]